MKYTPALLMSMGVVEQDFAESAFLTAVYAMLERYPL
jgi:hypothetical protein